MFKNPKHNTFITKETIELSHIFRVGVEPNMVPLHHRTTLTKSGEESPPRSSPPTAKGGGGGEDTPFENCAKKRRVGTTNANIYTPFCTDVTSVIAPLEIEGHTDEDGETKPAPITVKIEGAERGKDEGTEPAATTTAPAQLACHAGVAF